MGWLTRRVDVVLAGLAGLTTAVVLGGSIGRSFDYDEAIAVGTTIRQGSAVAALTETTVFNNHPIFAAGQAVWWELGGEGESRQRLLPVLYGEMAVAVLVAWLTRRLGPLPAAAAGLVVVANPMFVSQARAVRGYSLVVLAVVVAIVALVEYVRHVAPEGTEGTEAESEPGPAAAGDRTGLVLLGAHVAAVVVAMGTHVFAGAPLGAAGIAALVALGRIDRRLVASWAVAAAGLVLVYAPTIGALTDTARARGNRYRSGFGSHVTWEVLGRDRVTAVMLGALAVAGVVLLARRAVVDRPRVGAAVLVGLGLIVGQVLIVWQIARPFDLYARFFIGVVPIVVVLVAVAVRRVPALVGLVVVAVLFTAGNVRDARSNEVPIRDAAAVVIAGDRLDFRSCSVGGGSLQVYGGGTFELRGSELDPANAEAALADCDLFVVIGSWGFGLLEPAAERYPYAERLGSLRLFADVPFSELGR